MAQLRTTSGKTPGIESGSGSRNCLEVSLLRAGAGWGPKIAVRRPQPSDGADVAIGSLLCLWSAHGPDAQSLSYANAMSRSRQRH